MTEMTEEYNGIKFIREDVEDGEGLVIAVQAPEIVDIYTKHWDMGYLITSITLTEDGTILMNALRVEGD